MATALSKRLAKCLAGCFRGPTSHSVVPGYMIEGVPGRNWVELKKMLYGEPGLFEALLQRIVEVTVPHVLAQVDAEPGDTGRC